MGKQNPKNDALGDAKTRFATSEDLPQIMEIVNHSIRTSATNLSTAEYTPETIALWWAEHDARRPVIVCEINGKVVGWGALSTFRRIGGYDKTCENSVYVDHEFRAKGVGGMILCELIRLAREAGWSNIIAVITADNAASLILHEKQGFISRCVLPGVGYKNQRYFDVVLMQLSLL